jgi:hypothetical protein
VVEGFIATLGCAYGRGKASRIRSEAFFVLGLTRDTGASFGMIYGHLIEG